MVKKKRHKTEIARSIKDYHIAGNTRRYHEKVEAEMAGLQDGQIAVQGPLVAAGDKLRAQKNLASIDTLNSSDPAAQDLKEVAPKENGDEDSDLRRKCFLSLTSLEWDFKFAEAQYLGRADMMCTSWLNIRIRKDHDKIDFHSSHGLRCNRNRIEFLWGADPAFYPSVVIEWDPPEDGITGATVVVPGPARASSMLWAACDCYSLGICGNTFRRIKRRHISNKTAANYVLVSAVDNRSVRSRYGSTVYGLIGEAPEGDLASGLEVANCFWQQSGVLGASGDGGYIDRFGRSHVGCDSLYYVSEREARNLAGRSAVGRHQQSPGSRSTPNPQTPLSRNE